jgi:hypothetical protein
MEEEFHQGLFTLISLIKELTFNFAHRVDDLEALTLTLDVLHFHWSGLELHRARTVQVADSLGHLRDVLADLTRPRVGLLLKNVSVKATGVFTADRFNA